MPSVPPMMSGTANMPSAGINTSAAPAYTPGSDKGQVIFQKPGKMSWRYTNNGNRVVSDGKIIKVYEAENITIGKRVAVKVLEDLGLSDQIPVASLAKRFEVSTHREGQVATMALLCSSKASIASALSAEPAGGATAHELKPRVAKP